MVYERHRTGDQGLFASFWTQGVSGGKGKTVAWRRAILLLPHPLDMMAVALLACVCLVIYPVGLVIEALDGLEDAGS